MKLSLGKNGLLTALLLAASTALGLGASTGCAAESADEEVDSEDAELNAAGGRFGPQLFRNDFFTYLKRDGHFTDEQVRQLVLMPTDRAIDPHVAPNAAAPLAPYDAAFSQMRPMDFYQQGLVTPLVTKTGPDGVLEGELRRNPVHIVIVPGIFGEFIPVSPFEEVFRYGGAASVAWDKKLRALEADPTKKDLVRDRQFSAAAVKDVDRSMRDLVRVGSIDDQDGTPLVTVTYLKPEVGSLETFGTLDENADYYLSRLEKYFKITGMPDHLYVMGYSRGMATALNLVTRGEKAHASWMPRVKGVIGLAGVVYGSQLADVALAPGPQKDLLDTTVDFVQNQLQSCEGDTPVARSQATPSAWLMTKNLGHWTSFATRAGWQATRLGNRNAELSREGIETSMADVGRFVSFTRRVLFGEAKNVFSGVEDTSAISGILHLSSPSAEYCANIERFKVTATQIVKGVQTLTTESRMEWWKTHTVPANLRYFAITGTMGDATNEGEQPSPLALNETAYDTHSLDFRSLRGNYYDLLAASNNQLQDSQVPLPRGRFWPEIHGAINPEQGRMKTYFMGTLGIHHWGLSFPRAFSTRDGLEANPFPRTLLLKSIGTFVAQVERRGG